jgi:hypothetical protein
MVGDRGVVVKLLRRVMVNSNPAVLGKRITASLKETEVLRQYYYLGEKCKSQRLMAVGCTRATLQAGQGATQVGLLS